MSAASVLPEGVFPVSFAPTDPDAPHWAAARQGRVSIQRCNRCERFQWGPELVCHHCHSFDVGWRDIRPQGTVYSWERVWHPIRPELAHACPYLILLIEPDDAPGICLIGNYVGDQLDAIGIGDRMSAVFEPHEDYTLIQWTRERANGE